MFYEENIRKNGDNTYDEKPYWGNTVLSVPSQRLPGQESTQGKFVLQARVLCTDLRCNMLFIMVAAEPPHQQQLASASHGPSQQQLGAGLEQQQQ